MAEIGTTLRGARLERGLTIEEVAQATRISSRFLVALENEAFAEVPAPVYVRGFLRAYAGQLGLEPAALLEQLPPELAPPGVALQPPVPALAAPEESFADEEQVPARAVIERPPPPPLIDDMSAGRPVPTAPVAGAAAWDRTSTMASAMRALRQAWAQVLGTPPESAAAAEGILLERQPREPRLPASPRLIAIAGGGLGGAVLLIVGAVALSGGSGGALDGFLPGVAATKGPGSYTVIPVGSPSPEASPSPEPSPSPTETPTPEPTATRVPAPPTATAVPPTATAVPPTATATATPTDTPTETPTETPTTTTATTTATTTTPTTPTTTDEETAATAETETTSSEEPATESS